jgi:hypothetical protein
VLATALRGAGGEQQAQPGLEELLRVALVLAEPTARGLNTDGLGAGGRGGEVELEPCPGTLACCVRVVAATDATELQHVRDVYRIRAQVPFQAVVCASGILAVREGALPHSGREAARELGALVEGGARSRAGYIAAQLALADAVKQLESRAPPAQAHTHTADTWVAGRLNQRGVETVAAEVAGRQLARAAEQVAAAAATLDEEVVVGVRLLDGARLVGKFRKAEPMSSVFAFVDEKRTDGTAAYRLTVPAPRTVLDRAQGSVGDLPRNKLLLLEPLDPSAGVHLRRGPVNQQQQQQQQHTSLLGRLWALLMAAIMSIFVSQRALPQTQRQQHGDGYSNNTRDNTADHDDRDPSAGHGDRDREPTELFGGDSTAFLG